VAVIGDPKSPLGVRALEAVGLPAAGCASLELHFLPNSVVTAVATYHPSDEQAEKLVRVLKESEAK
jgi:hypothetical protein